VGRVDERGRYGHTLIPVMHLADLVLFSYCDGGFSVPLASDCVDADIRMVLCGRDQGF
jgi:hypothetical protein